MSPLGTESPSQHVAEVEVQLCEFQGISPFEQLRGSEVGLNRLGSTQKPAYRSVNPCPHERQTGTRTPKPLLPVVQGFLSRHSARSIVRRERGTAGKQPAP